MAGEAARALSETPIRVRCRLAGAIVEGIAWTEAGDAPGMAMFKRVAFDYAHPISLSCIVTTLPSLRVGEGSEGGQRT